MVKIANHISFLPLRDIRLASVKPLVSKAGGRASSNDTDADAGGRGLKGKRSQAASEMSEEALQAREQAGYERGLKEAEEQRAKQVEQLRAEWEAGHRTDTIRILDQLNKSVYGQISEVFKSLEKHVVMLAAEAAIKLTSGMPISADMVEAYVREAMNLVEQDTEVAIAINPADLALLEQHQSSLLNQAGTLPVVKFRADSKISRGGCMVETKFGELDARRETKIELLRKAVNE